VFLGKVVGTVVASAKSEGLKGFKLLLIQPLEVKGNNNYKDCGPVIVATDRIGVGSGEIVFLEKSKEAILGLPDLLVPSDASVVGRVDSINVQDNFS